MFNIRKAVSRLDFAPRIEEIKITEVKKGLGHFTPKPEKAVSFAVLKDTIKKSGYTLSAAEITVSGTLMRDDAEWEIESEASQQRFSLVGGNLEEVLGGATSGSRIEITGEWQTEG